jgi:hypothetical protein
MDEEGKRGEEAAEAQGGRGEGRRGVWEDEKGREKEEGMEDRRRDGGEPAGTSEGGVWRRCRWKSCTCKLPAPAARWADSGWRGDTSLARKGWWSMLTRMGFISSIVARAMSGGAEVKLVPWANITAGRKRFRGRPAGAELEAELDRWKERGWAEPWTEPPWPRAAMPIFGIKKASGETRVIQDARQVNALSQTVPKIKLPTISQVSEMWWPGTATAVIDAASAFYSVPLRAKAQRWMAMYVGGAAPLWRMKRLSMGWKNSPGLFARGLLAAAHWALLHLPRGTRAAIYMDDLHLFFPPTTGPDQQRDMAQAVADTLAAAGWTEKAEKRQTGHDISYLGLMWTLSEDGEAATATVPEHKLASVAELVDKLCSKPLVPLKAMASLLGKLRAWRDVYQDVLLDTRGIQVFLTEGLRRFGWTGFCKPHAWLREAARVVIERAGQCSLALGHKPVIWEGMTDASGTWGLGGVAWSTRGQGRTVWAQRQWLPHELGFNIAIKELLGLLQTLEAVSKTAGRAQAPARLRMWVDNRVVVGWVRRRRAGPTTAVPLLRKLHKLLRDMGWTLDVGWVASKENVIADGLSRGWTRETAKTALKGLQKLVRGRGHKSTPPEPGTRLQAICGSRFKAGDDWVEAFTGSEGPVWPWTTWWGTQLGWGVRANGLDLLDPSHPVWSRVNPRATTLWLNLPPPCYRRRC